MKCLIRNSDNVVIYAQDDLELFDDKLKSDGWIDYNFNTSNSIILDLEIPDDLIGGAYAYVDGAFIIFNQSVIDDYKNLLTPKINSISMRQARLQLLTMDLLDTVNSAITGMSQAAQIEWEYSTEVKRDYPLVIALQTGLSMDDTTMDSFFYNASLL